MKVLFDHQIFSLQKYGGISRYFANLYYGLKPEDEIQPEIGFLFTNNAYIKNERFLSSIYKGIITKKSRIYKFNKWYCRRLLKQNDFNVFHPTYYHPYFLELVKKPVVLTVHDMINELYPHYFKADPFITHKKKLIERADHIIAISESTKNDIQHFYNIDDNKISIIYHGYQMRETNASPDIAVNKKKYLLYVGDRAGYKNFNRCIQSSAHLLLKYSIKLICAGGGTFNAEEIQLFNRLNIMNVVEQLTITDDQLTCLYINAIALIYPSLYEGFGLPVLEAFYNNCPVILSNTSSLPEVGGQAAAYFDPTEEASITFAVERVISDDELQKKMKFAGSKRLELFRFENCLQKTKAVYLSLV